jgi:FkbM family methyltransferase
MGLIGSILVRFSKPMPTSKKHLEFFDKNKIRIDFVVEAGGYDGTDTRVFLEKDLFCFVFEPDPVSRIKFMSNVSPKNTDKLYIYDKALSNENGTSVLFFEEEFGAGFGSSSLIIPTLNNDSDMVQVEEVRFSDYMPSRTEFSVFANSENVSNGFLWLDVEGYALPALKGFGSQLRLMAAANIEVEFQPMHPKWEHSNFLEVLVFMKSERFRLRKVSLQPTYRGDAFFLRESELSWVSLTRCICLELIAKFLHGVLYKKHLARDEVRQLRNNEI